MSITLKGPCTQISKKLGPQSTQMGTSLRHTWTLRVRVTLMGLGFGRLDDWNTVEDIRPAHYLKDPKLWELWHIPDYG